MIEMKVGAYCWCLMRREEGGREEGGKKIGRKERKEGGAEEEDRGRGLAI